MLEGWEVKAYAPAACNSGSLHHHPRWHAAFIRCPHQSLLNASTHIHPDPTRTRQLLLNAREIEKLISKVQRAGYTIMPLDMHYKGSLIKLDIGLAKGKKEHDKRETEREKDAKREASKP